MATNPFSIDASSLTARFTEAPVKAACWVRLLAAAALLLVPAPAIGQRAAEDPEAVSALTELREARRLAEDPGQGRQAGPRLVRALANVEAWPEAERVARELVEADVSADNVLLLAWTLRRQERLEAAIGVLEQYLDQDSADPTRDPAAPGGVAADAVRQELALLYLSAGAPARALDTIDAAQDPDLGVRGLALAALPARDTDATRALRSALDRPDTTVVPTSDLVRELGIVLLEGAQPEDALPHLRATAEAFPHDPDAAYRLARVQRALGQTEQARSTMERFQALRESADRRDTEQRALGTELNDAQELAQQNLLDEALRKVDRIIDTYPDSYSALALRAKIRFSLGRAGDALSDTKRASQLAPGITEFHYLEGLFERTSGNNDSAREALLRALTLDPDLVEAHALLGGIELDLGNPRAALEHFEAAVELGASGAQIDRAMEIARQRAEGSP